MQRVAYKMAYWTCNTIDNFVGTWLSSPEVPVLHAKLKPLQEIEPFINYKSSPSRLLSDAFLESLPVEKIVKELGDIRMIDMGCGKGHYFFRFKRVFGNSLKKYVGVDRMVFDEWDGILRNSGSMVEFSTMEWKSVFENFRNKINFVISISVLEHIEDDLDLINDIHGYLVADAPFIQIHLIPSAPCLRLYRVHGCRQYTPRSINKIKRTVSGKGNTRTLLICLGGDKCNRVHYEYITKPFFLSWPALDYREIKAEKYKEALIKCYNEEMDSSLSSPSFYALIIESNIGETVFGQ